MNTKADFPHNANDLITNAKQVVKDAAAVAIGLGVLGVNRLNATARKAKTQIEACLRSDNHK